MAEHDDELDRRITAMLGLAQQDAPAPELAPLPAPRHLGRWVAIAAAIALIGAAGVALALRDSNTGRATVDSVIPSVTSAVGSTSTPTESSVAPSTTIGTPSDCGAPAVDSYDTIGSMHTIVPSNQALDIQLVALDTPWCPGGTGLVRLTATNIGAGQEQLDPIELILNGGMNKYPLDHVPTGSEPDILSIAPGSGITVDYHVRIPGVPPGSYTLQVYGFGSGTGVRVDGPTACATADLQAVVGDHDGAGGREMTPITVTNTGNEACFLGRPLAVEGTAPDGSTSATPIPFETGGFFPVDDSRPSRVLAPGESTLVALTTDNHCLQPTTQTVLWSQIRLLMDPLGDSTVIADISKAENRPQTVCGLWVTGWATPTE